MELVIRRRVKGLCMLLSLDEATVTSVQNVYRYGAYHLFQVGCSRYFIHTSYGSSFGTEHPVIFSHASVPANLSRGPPELVWKLFILCLIG